MCCFRAEGPDVTLLLNGRQSRPMLGAACHWNVVRLHVMFAALTCPVMSCSQLKELAAVSARPCSS
jgi:hypothetical protein